MAKILIVEDNPANLTLSIFLLQRAGHTVLSATDAEPGLALARNEQPNLILMDIQLPGMDGLEAIALLKKDDATRAIPVIALTALAMKGDEERIRAAGCDGYIAKPIRYQEFLATIAAQLGGKMNPLPDIADPPARILIVDDERANRELLELMLAPEGFLLQTAATGEEALAMVAQEPPDLILLDLMMPGMDGYRVTKQIKRSRATKNVAIVILSALYDRSAKILALTAGAEDFLTKPVDRAELCIRVRNLLQLKAYSDFHHKYSQTPEGERGSPSTNLIESERLYRSTFDTAPIGIAHTGLDGQWVEVNQHLCDLLGYSRKELLSRAVQELMQSEEEEKVGEAESFHDMSSGMRDRHVVDEKRYRRRDGTFVWARLNMSLHRDAEGQCQHFISVIEDIKGLRPPAAA